MPAFSQYRKIFTAAFVSAALVGCATGPSQTIRFEIRASSLEERAGWQKINSQTSSGTAAYVAPETLVGNNDIAVAQASEDFSGHPLLRIDLTPEGTARLAQASKALIGQELAILIDGEIVSVATLRSPMETGQLAIMWPKSLDDARRVANGIHSSK